MIARRLEPFLPLVGVVGSARDLVDRDRRRIGSIRCCCRRRPSAFNALWKGMDGGALGFDFMQDGLSHGDGDR